MGADRPRQSRTTPSPVVVTCEHGGNQVPAAYRAYFTNARRELDSHRGYDPGAAELAKQFARTLGVQPYLAFVTRLLVELNRSLGHPRLFSRYVQAMDPSTRQRVLQRYYFPYRQAVTEQIERLRESVPCVCHLSVHSFTPVLNGERRTADVGLLYDSRRTEERAFCDAWRNVLRTTMPELRVRRNYPYLGSADGFTTALRKQFVGAEYLGIELEVNQAWVRRGGAAWRTLQTALVDSFVQTLAAGAERTSSSVRSS